jgi:hypothetical protein
MKERTFMAKLRAKDTLKAFHEGSVLGLPGLQRWILRSARKPATVRSVLEESHGRWLAAVKSSCFDFAANHGTDLPRVFRNLVASADANDLDFWRHALDHGALDTFGARDALDRVLRVAEERAPRNRKRFLPALEALSRASTSEPASLSPLVATLWPVAFALSRHLPAEKVPAYLLQVMRADGPQRSGTARRMALALQQIAAERPAAAFDLESFGGIPEQVLAKFQDPRCLLNKAEAEKRERNEARKKRAAELLMAFVATHSEDVMRAVSDLFATEEDRRAKAWPAIGQSLAKLNRRIDATSRGVLERKVCDELQAKRAQWLAIPRASAKALRTIRGSSFGAASSLLGYLGMDRRQQCLVNIRDTVDLNRIGRTFSLDEGFENALLSAATAEYLRSRNARSAAWDAWGIEESRYASQKRRVDPWRHVFLASRTLAPGEARAALNWLRCATDADREKFVELHAAWLMRRAGGRAFVERAMEFLPFETAALLLGGTCLRQFLVASRAMGYRPSTNKRPAVAAPLTILIDKSFNSPGGKTCIADRLVADGPAQIGVMQTVDLLGSHLDATRLEKIIAGIAGGPAADAALSKVLARARQYDTGALASALRTLLDGKQLSQAIVTSIWRYALKRSRKDALDLFTRAPQHFAALAAAELPVAELLLLAVGSPIMAKHLAGKIEPAVLRAALPEMRRRLVADSRKLVIVELAALSDLIEIVHLKEIQRSVSMEWERDPGTRLDHRYRTYQIPKRSGGNRTITVPDDGLKRLQRRLLAGAFELVPLHDAAHGFRTGRSILSNAKQHVAKRLVVNVDISKFFPSTLHASVLSACMKVDGGNISAETALLLAEICCYNGALPTGAPTSPAIGNIVLRRADRAIAKAAAENGISYTRYADDLTFSGDSNAKQILPFVRKVLGECGYEIDGKKTQLYRRGRQQLVTNLVVNDKANLRRSDRRRLRAAVNHRCSGKPVIWHGRPMPDAELRGRLALLAMVSRDEARVHMDRLNAEASEWVKRDG